MSAEALYLVRIRRPRGVFYIRETMLGDGTMDVQEVRSPADATPFDVHAAAESAGYAVRYSKLPTTDDMVDSVPAGSNPLDSAARVVTAFPTWSALVDAMAGSGYVPTLLPTTRRARLLARHVRAAGFRTFDGRTTCHPNRPAAPGSRPLV